MADPMARTDQSLDSLEQPPSVEENRSNPFTITSPPIPELNENQRITLEKAFKLGAFSEKLQSAQKAVKTHFLHETLDYKW